MIAKIIITKPFKKLFPLLIALFLSSFKDYIF